MMLENKKYTPEMKRAEISALAEMIPKGGTGIEIGTWRGHSARLLCELADVKWLYTVDPWSVEAYRQDEDGSEHRNFNIFLNRYSSVSGGTEEEDFYKFYEETYFRVLEELRPFRCTVYRMMADDFFEMFRKLKSKVDWVYIDGNHGYKEVTNDLENSLTVLKKGGIIIGDDYGKHKPNVIKAVDDFVKKHDLKLELLGKYVKYRISL